MAVPVARGLRPSLDALARELPTDLATTADILGYRRATAPRDEPAAAVAARLGLRLEERVTRDGDPLTILLRDRPPRARVVFLHGGGLVAGSRRSGLDVVARHAADLSLEVRSLEYPLAPEARFDEMVRSVLRAVSDARDEGEPVVLAGQSGGGGLAAAAMLACRDRGIPLAGHLLIHPMLGRGSGASAQQYAHDPSWSARSTLTAWDAALASTAEVTPAERRDLLGLPPTFLDVGSAELFRDDVVDFARALWAAGRRAELHVWSGAFHASDCVDESAPASIAAHAARRDWLARLLDGEV